MNNKTQNEVKKNVATGASTAAGATVGVVIGTAVTPNSAEAAEVEVSNETPQPTPTPQPQPEPIKPEPQPAPQIDPKPENPVAPKPTPVEPEPKPVTIKAGDMVVVNGIGRASSYGTGARTREFKGRTMKVIAISKGAKYPYACNQYGEGRVSEWAKVTAWFKESDVKKV